MVLNDLFFSFVIALGFIVAVVVVSVILIKHVDKD